METLRSGIVLAAGASSRMGTDKALLRLGDATFLSLIARNLQEVCEHLIVVIGHHAHEITAAHPQLAGSWVLNQNWSRGQFSSLQTGARAALARAQESEGLQAFVVVPIDHPAFSASTVLALADAFSERGGDVIKPSYAGRNGHPVLYSPAFMQAVVTTPPTASTRDIQALFTATTTIVPVNDPGVLMNIDSPADYEQLKQRGP